MDAKKVLVRDSGGRMTASEGLWWQNEGYWVLNLMRAIWNLMKAKAGLAISMGL